MRSAECCPQEAGSRSLFPRGDLHDRGGGGAPGAHRQACSWPKSAGAPLPGGALLYRQRGDRHPHVSQWLRPSRSRSSGDQATDPALLCRRHECSPAFAWNRQYWLLGEAWGWCWRALTATASPQLFPGARIRQWDSRNKRADMFSSVLQAPVSWPGSSVHRRPSRLPSVTASGDVSGLRPRLSHLCLRGLALVASCRC